MACHLAWQQVKRHNTASGGACVAKRAQVLPCHATSLLVMLAMTIPL